jgi:hypothetical protein
MSEQDMDIFQYEIPSFRMLLRIVRHALRWAWEDIKERPLWMLPIGVVFLGVGWYVDVVSALLWMIFLMFLIYRWNNRILGSIAILLLVACPVLLSLDLQNWAELIAVYAFFFLVMTVTLQLIDLKHTKQPEKS